MAVSRFPFDALLYTTVARTTSQFDVSNSTTLVDVPNMTLTLEGGKEYGIYGSITTACVNNQGISFGFDSTGPGFSATRLNYVVMSGGTLAQNLIGIAGNFAAQSIGVNPYVQLFGTVITNAGTPTTLTISFAQSVAGLTASSVLHPSFLLAWPLN